MFVPTKHQTVADKMRFVTQFHTFASNGYKEEDFTKWFYRRLAMMFGLSQHFSRSHFYEHWFATANRRYDFLVKIQQWQPKGDPKVSFADVEAHVQKMLHDYGWVKDQLDQSIAELLSSQADVELMVPKVMFR